MYFITKNKKRKVTATAVAAKCKGIMTVLFSFVFIFSLIFGTFSSRDCLYKINTVEAQMIRGCDKDYSELLKQPFEKSHVFDLKGAKLFLPNYKVDLIQKTIYNTKDWWDGDILRRLDKYIPEGANILDLGANIGNHTIYWARQNKVNKVIAFEPVKYTLDILKKNIALNNLYNKVTICDVGLSDKTSKAVIAKWHEYNIGGTNIIDTDDGDMEVDKLDNIIYPINLKHIDFVKIDIEGHEVMALKGAKRVFKEYKPKYVYIESFSNHIDQTKQILKDYGYKLANFPVIANNYLFEHK